MAAYNEVFKRIEKKYKVNPTQRNAVEGFFFDVLQPDAYGRSRITSIYWDTPSWGLISRSLETPKYKEKLRARAYGEEAGEALLRACIAGVVAPEDGAHLVFFEIKKKFKRVVYKRRIGLSLAALFAFLDGVPYEEAVAAYPTAFDEANQLAASPLNRQIAREIFAMLRRYEDMAPAMAIRCERTAWAPVESTPEESPYAQLRVTFDDNLCYMNLRAASAWTPILPASTAIMELKNAGPLPVAFASLLAKHDIYPTSFSKYGTAYQMTAFAAGQAPGLECVFGQSANGEGVGFSARSPQHAQSTLRNVPTSVISSGARSAESRDPVSDGRGSDVPSRLRRARDLSTAALRAFGRDDVEGESLRAFGRDDVKSNNYRKKGERCA